MARMELVDSQTIEACNDYFNEDMHVSPHLFLEFHGSEDSVNEQSKLVSEIAESFSAQISSGLQDKKKETNFGKIDIMHFMP